MPTEKNNAGAELTEMYRATTPFLEEYPWEMEDDRWAELIISLFSGIGIDPSISKHAVDLLKGLNVLTPKDLEEMKDGKIHFIHQVLLQAGMKADEAEASADALIRFSRLINNKWNGYIQKFLRGYGTKMVRELQSYLTRSGIESEQSKRIATVWLQNVCNLPILLDGDPHIRNFCSKFRLTETALVDMLDELGLNACLADDLLAIHHEPDGSLKRSKKQRPNEKAAKKAGH
jgi:hypothetical protein